MGHSWKWMLLENALVAAAVRGWYTRNRTVQMVPVGMFESRNVEDLNRGLEPRTTRITLTTTGSTGSGGTSTRSSTTATAACSSCRPPTS